MSICKTISAALLMLALIHFQVYSQVMPESQYFDSNGISIYYIEQGSGEALILLHGNTGNVESWMGNGIFQELAEDYRVIAFDARGHGKSDKPHDVAAYGNEMSLDIIRLMDHLKIEKAHVIASSMGVRVFGKLMPAHPDRFASAVLIGFAPKWRWTADDQSAVEERAENRLNNPPKRLLDEGQDVQALATLVLGFHELVITEEEVKNIKIPTITIIGSEDRYIPRVKEMKILMQEMELLIIEGEKHGLRNLAPHPEFLETIKRFLSKHGLRQ